MIFRFQSVRLSKAMLFTKSSINFLIKKVDFTAVDPKLRSFKIK